MHPGPIITSGRPWLYSMRDLTVRGGVEMTGTTRQNAMIKDYDVGKTIGQGSFAVVKAGRHKASGDRVAIKMVEKCHPKFDAASLENEIAAMTVAHHPNCVQLHAIYYEPDRTCLVLDLVHGGTVMDRIIEHNHLSEQEAAAVTAGVLAALIHLNGFGIAHRDIKPENLLYVSKDRASPHYNTIKVTDFGLSTSFSGDASGTEASVNMKTACGTYGYAAPEILDPDRLSAEGYGVKVDVWSLGVVLYVMLCGFPPFFDESVVKLFQTIRRGEYGFPSPYWDGVSHDAKDLVANMLVVQPSTRRSATECMGHPFLQHACCERQHCLNTSGSHVPADMGHDGHHHGPRNSKVQALGEVSVQLENATGISSNVTSNADEAQDIKSDQSANDRAKSEARAHEECLDTLFQQLLRQHTRALRAQLLRAKHKEQMLLESLDSAQQEIAQSCGGKNRYPSLATVYHSCLLGRSSNYDSWSQMSDANEGTTSTNSSRSSSSSQCSHPRLDQQPKVYQIVEFRDHGVDHQLL